MMSDNHILIGGEALRGKAILGGNCFLGESLAGDELSVDTLTAQVECAGTVPTLFCPADADGLLTVEDELFGVRPWGSVMIHDLSVFGYGEPVYYYHPVADRLIGKFFLSSLKRVGKSVYELSCVSAVGLLDNLPHYGGLYTGQTMGEVLADIVGGRIEYTLAAELAGLPVYGWLPVATRRENLHQLLFAMGGSLKKDATGTVQIIALSGDGVAGLSRDRLMLGGNVDYRTPASVVNVSEHTYMAYDSDKEETLYEGEAPAETLTTPKGEMVSGVLVLFGGPMHDLKVDNGEILESGVNYAVLGQSSNCKLTGKAYTHTTRIITLQAEAARTLVATEENVVTVSDATLVSLANSENVAKRVLAYYGSAKVVNTDLVVGDERPGDPVRFEDPFGDQTEGFVQALDITLSGRLKAAAKLVAGYVPTGIGNYYQHFALLTQGGRFVVPPECKGKIRVVLIGGGQGGWSGAKGDDGEGGFSPVDGKGGAGGQGGQGGKGGNVLIATISAAPGQEFAVTIGEGGIGGIMAEDGAANPGGEGGATTFGSYTSADGKASETGYVNIMDKSEYGHTGASGIFGSKGSGSDGPGPDITHNGVTYKPGAKGETGRYSSSYGMGGYGGGPSVGESGHPGNGGRAYKQPNDSIAADAGHGGDGGSGAKGEDATGHGQGGQGGHGGGGGGGSGYAYSQSGSNYAFGGAGGNGGAGGQGGNGGPGVVIIYY